MLTTLMIVDDFLNNAQELRERALHLTYPEQEGAFPGRNSLERIALDGLDQAVSRLVGEPLVPVSPLQSHAKCRLTLASDRGRAKVHIDNSHWSGILYLSRDEDSIGGTEFFRHIRTNSDRAPVYKEELAGRGYESFEQMHADIIENDSNDDSKWELTTRVPMRFNRLVLLRPWLWHTAGPGFGDTPENGRLVFLMFFQSARQG
ncbi:MAG TPA: DUF6445 family protein [Sphingomicrobium sp.]